MILPAIVKSNSFADKLKVNFKAKSNQKLKSEN